MKTSLSLFGILVRHARELNVIVVVFKSIESSICYVYKCSKISERKTLSSALSIRLSIESSAVGGIRRTKEVHIRVVTSSVAL